MKTTRLPKDLRAWVHAALAAGWRLEAKRRHTWLLAPDGETTVCIPGTPSDHRTIANTVAGFKRAGVRL